MGHTISSFASIPSKPNYNERINTISDSYDIKGRKLIKNVADIGCQYRLNTISDVKKKTKLMKRMTDKNII